MRCPNGPIGVNNYAYLNSIARSFNPSAAVRLNYSRRAGVVRDTLDLIDDFVVCPTRRELAFTCARASTMTTASSIAIKNVLTPVRIDGLSFIDRLRWWLATAARAWATRH